MNDGLIWKKVPDEPDAFVGTIIFEWKHTVRPCPTTEDELVEAVHDTCLDVLARMTEHR